MTEQIGKCPYCGSDQVETMETWGKRYVNCNDCNATGPTTTGSKNDAVLLWNAAANALSKKDAEIAELKGDLDNERQQNCFLDRCIDRWNERGAELEADRDKMAAAYADAEERRHETVSKLSLALIREAASNKRQDELEAEIERMREHNKNLFLRIDQLNEYKEIWYKRAMESLTERDEARRVARVWYNAAGMWKEKHDEYKLAYQTLDAMIKIGARNEPPTSRVETTDNATP